MAGYSKQVAQAVRETSPVPYGSCKTCERVGMPVLPLRWAVVPKNNAVRALRKLGNADTQLSLRTLRAGYLYVLLDRSVWQAYQVSPEGCLRQFNPYQAPHGTPAPLAKQCVTQGHDIRSSFIHIDTSAYEQAQIAFANDPWPVSVLDAYKTGNDAQGKKLDPSYLQRFTTYTLAKLKSAPLPAEHALPLEHGDALAQMVAEYAHGYEDFGSVHEFHSRADRLEAMGMYLRQAEKLNGLATGVAGLMLPDPIGLAQELNGLVRAVQTQRQLWAQDEAGTLVGVGANRRSVKHLRPYQYLTSQCLLGIKTLYARQADAQTSDSATPMLDYMPSESGTPPVFGDPAKERAEVVKHKTDQQVDRLQKRYHEPARKAFQDAYDTQMADFQRAIDAHGKDWAAQIMGLAWKCAVRHDYAGTDKYSAVACLKAVAASLAGGPSEALPPPPAPGSTPKPEVLGPTSAAWKALLEDAASPLYAALLAQNAALRNAFTPILGAGAMPNDAGKKYYDTIKAIMGSSEINTFREHNVHDAVDALLGAMQNAASRLDRQLSEGVKAAISHIHSGSALFYAGVHLTQVKVQLTVGEYYNLLSEQLHGSADRAAHALGKQARAMLFAGLISIPSPAVRNTLIEVTLWARGTADQVKAEITNLRAAAQTGADNTWRKLVAGVKNLEPLAAQALHDIQISAASARLFAGRSFAGLRSLAGGSADGGLAILSLYFQADTLKNNLAAIDKAVGANHPEAVAAMYGASVGVMGAGLEVAGLGLKVPAEAARAFIQRGGMAEPPVLTRVIGVGRDLVKTAGVIGALVGIADGAQSVMAATRAKSAGDTDARNAHYVAASLSVFGAAIGANAVMLNATALIGGSLVLGPLGWALIFSLTSYAVTQYAKSQESAPLERWARRCYFGDHAEKPPVAWLLPTDMDTAIAELNAAVLGMDVTLGFNSELRLKDDAALAQTPVEDLKNGGALESGIALKYRIVLPAYDPVVSSYRFELIVQRFGLSSGSNMLRDKSTEVAPQTLASGEHNSGNSVSPISPSPHRIPDYVAQASTTPTKKQPVISGGFSLDAFHSIKSATLVISYWPDKNDIEGFARVELKEMAP
ncbi:T6SS effector BTH_I2691 family protein [Achromobacter spanius]|uniref:T6SS effector BTH_I2691 family protein n=1 Tax=Achromobacter spanius TaxID=217203 RepID=UPI00320B15E1